MSLIPEIPNPYLAAFAVGLLYGITFALQHVCLTFKLYRWHRSWFPQRSNCNIDLQLGSRNGIRHNWRLNRRIKISCNRCCLFVLPKILFVRFRHCNHSNRHTYFSQNQVAFLQLQCGEWEEFGRNEAV